MAWEYKIVYSGMEVPDEEKYEQRLHDSVRMLNDLGGEGWELVAFLPHRTAANLTKYHAVLKRQKNP